MRRLIVTMLLATAASALATGQPGEARKNHAEAAIPLLPPPDTLEQRLAEEALAMALDDPEAAETSDTAEAEALADIAPAAGPWWSVAVVVGDDTRCALGPSMDCLAYDQRLRAAGIVLDPDEPAPPPAASPATPPAPTRADDSPAAAREALAPRVRPATLRPLTPDLVVPAVQATAPRTEAGADAPAAASGSPVAMPLQWRIATGAWLDLRPRTELNFARGRTAPNTDPADGGPPIPGTARVRLGITVPLEALRTQASRPLGATPPPPGVALLP